MTSRGSTLLTTLHTTEGSHQAVINQGFRTACRHLSNTHCPVASDGLRLSPVSVPWLLCEGCLLSGVGPFLER